MHRLLRHLRAAGLRGVPEVFGFDELGREVLSYLPGRVVDVDTELLTDAQLVGLAGWTREFHDAVEGFADAGPWRFPAPRGAELVGHNDLAPYNACFAGDRLVGVFDWDLAGPTTRLLELAHLAWTAVPLFRPIPAEDAGHRLRLSPRLMEASRPRRSWVRCPSACRVRSRPSVPVWPPGTRACSTSPRWGSRSTPSAPWPGSCRDSPRSSPPSPEPGAAAQ